MLATRKQAKCSIAAVYARLHESDLQLARNNTRKLSLVDVDDLISSMSVEEGEKNLIIIPPMTASKFKQMIADKRSKLANS